MESLDFAAYHNKPRIQQLDVDPLRDSAEIGAAIIHRIDIRLPKEHSTYV